MRGPRLTLLAAGVAAGVLLAGCSAEENPRLIPRDDAEAIIASLDGIETAVADGECDLAQERLQGAANQVATLPTRVDGDLRRRLEDGLAHLAQRIPEDCQPEEEPAETPTVEPTPTPTPEATPTPEETPTPEATPTPDTGEGDGGDSGPGGGQGNGQGGGQGGEE